MKRMSQREWNVTKSFNDGVEATLDIIDNPTKDDLFKKVQYSLLAIVAVCIANNAVFQRKAFDWNQEISNLVCLRVSLASILHMIKRDDKAFFCLSSHIFYLQKYAFTTTTRWRVRT